MYVPDISGVFFFMSLLQTGVLHNPPIAKRAWAHQRGLIHRFLGFAALREVVFEEVNLEQLQVEF
jgi:hypothetical protein